MMKGGGGIKNLKKLMTSFMNGPKGDLQPLKNQSCIQFSSLPLLPRCCFKEKQ